MESKKDNVIAAEISEGYSVADVEQFKKMFEEKLQKGISRVNILAKINKLDASKISCKAFFEDSMYALRHIKNMGHIAVIGHSNFKKVLITLDGRNCYITH